MDPASVQDMAPVAVAVGLVVATGLWFLTRKRKVPKFLDENNRKRIAVPLVQVSKLSHDTRRFRFGLTDPEQELGLDVGKAFKFFCPAPIPTEAGFWNGREDSESSKKEIERKYTPVSVANQKGYFELIVKVYAGNITKVMPDGKEQHWTDGGKMSQYLDKMKIGDTIDMQGPYGLIHYLGQGQIKVGQQIRNVSNIAMVAGGTGITPMLQLIQAVLNDPNDSTKIQLVYANQQEEDILCRDILEEYQKENPDRLSIWYTLDHAPRGWKYSQGFINQEMLGAHLCKPADDAVVCLCGPPPMIKFACLPNLEKLGWAPEAALQF